MGSNNKNYKSDAAKKMNARPQKKVEPRPAKRTNVHGDGKPNHNRGR